MHKLFAAIALITCLAGALRAQTPAVDLVLSISDGAGGSQQLHFGLGPSASDGIDTIYGESELPPAPPSGVFDARFVGDDIGITLGQGVARDFRLGTASSTVSKTHELKYQVGAGSSITIAWNLPPKTSGLLQDIITGSVVHVTMTGSGNYTVGNPSGISKLKMTVNYNTASATPMFTLPLTVSDGAGGTQNLCFGVDSTATDTIDCGIGEAELPPFPPSGVFDARFIGDDIGINLGQGLLADYRYGTRWTSGIRIYELRYQPGSGTSITISWKLGAWATGVLQDIITGTIIRDTMHETGSFVVTNPSAISKLKMTIYYHPLLSIGGVQAGEVPKEFALFQNYPNPFNPTTTIGFSLPVRSSLRMTIHDALGQLVQEVLNGELDAGFHEIRFDGGKLSSGVYFYRLQAGTHVAVKRLVLIR